MNTLETVDELRAVVRGWREAGERVAFVPTMGNLHAGHIELVKTAHAHAQRVVASIFVNPLQFGAGEDLDAYPRTLEEDRNKLTAAGADLLFAPTVAEMYPRPQAEQTRVEVPGLSDELCGASRPGHFAGVATVVCKLFNMVQPDLALFGEKDFQQLLVIRRMVEDLCVPVEILGVPTVREPDGLAMSSRNGYLTADERAVAPRLYASLQQMAAALQEGRRDFAALESEAAQRFEAAGLRTDYVQLRRADDLRLPDGNDQELVILAAAHLGRARLIDNLRVSLSSH